MKLASTQRSTWKSKQAIVAIGLCVALTAGGVWAWRQPSQPTPIFIAALVFDASPTA